MKNLEENLAKVTPIYMFVVVVVIIIIIAIVSITITYDKREAEPRPSVGRPASAPQPETTKHSPAAEQLGFLLIAAWENTYRRRTQTMKNMGHLINGVYERIYVGLGLCLGNCGVGLSKQWFARHWVLSKTGHTSMPSFMLDPTVNLTYREGSLE